MEKKQKSGIRVLEILALMIGTVIIIEILSVNAFAIEDSKGKKVPIIMYHSILHNSSRTGDYVLDEKQLEEDIIYLKANGYTTLFISDLVSYVYEGTELPEKCVVLTFDDGFRNSLVNVLPLLLKYNVKANVAVVGYYSELYSSLDDHNPAYAYLDYDDIRELKNSGLVEIGNHSYNMHSNDYKRKGVLKKKNESIEDYTDVFIRDTFMTENAIYKKCGVKPRFYAYPFGFSCPESEEILKGLGYKATLTCDQKMNYITRDPKCLYKLNRYNRPGGISTEKYMKKVLR